MDLVNKVVFSEYNGKYKQKFLKLLIQGNNVILFQALADSSHSIVLQLAKHPLLESI